MLGISACCSALPCRAGPKRLKLMRFFYSIFHDFDGIFHRNPTSPKLCRCFVQRLCWSGTLVPQDLFPLRPFSSQVDLIWGLEWQISTWVGSPKKAPTSPQNTMFSLHFLKKTWGLWGAFLADQSKWKELGSTWLASSWFYFWQKFKVVSAGQHLGFSVLSLWLPEHQGQQWDPGPEVTSESQLSSWVGLKKHHKARKIMCLSYDFWRVSWLAGVFFKPAHMEQL